MEGKQKRLHSWQFSISLEFMRRPRGFFSKINIKDMSETIMNLETNVTAHAQTWRVVSSWFLNNSKAWDFFLQSGLKVPERVIHQEIQPLVWTTQHFRANISSGRRTVSPVFLTTLYRNARATNIASRCAVKTRIKQQFCLLKLTSILSVQVLKCSEFLHNCFFVFLLSSRTQLNIPNWTSDQLQTLNLPDKNEKRTICWNKTYHE